MKAGFISLLYPFIVQIEQDYPFLPTRGFMSTPHQSSAKSLYRRLNEVFLSLVLVGF